MILNDKGGMKLIGHVVVQEHDYSIDADGKCVIVPNTAVTKVDKFNAIHPQNMARIIARALANEDNHFIHRIAFGNGGTQIDIAGNIIYQPPRDGLNPGDGGWEAGLYNETYTEIVDDSNIGVGSGPGSSPSDDPESVEHISGPGVRSIEDLNIGSTVSSVVITSVLNPNEPKGQALTQMGGTNGNTSIEADFVFDEIGLFTGGLPGSDTAGYQYVNVNNKESKMFTGLTPNTVYQFTIRVDNGSPVVVSITTPNSGSGDGVNAPIGSITYSDLLTILNSPVSNLSIAGAVAKITDDIPTQSGGSETFGYLMFESISKGQNSSIRLTDISLFSSLEGFSEILAPVDGYPAGVRNDPSNPERERERLLAHLTFSPVEKSADRVLTIVYTIHVVVARTVRN